MYVHTDKLSIWQKEKSEKLPKGIIVYAPHTALP
jgi:hypothetical protein